MNKGIVVFLLLVLTSFECGVCENNYSSNQGGVVILPARAKVAILRPLLEVVELFDDAEGYRGKWRELPALGSKFYLPEGWYGRAYDELAEGVTAFSGGNGDDTVDLFVTQWDSVEYGEYNSQTGETFLEYVAESLPDDRITLTKVNGTEVVLYLNNSSDRKLVFVPQLKQVVCFSFCCHVPNSIEDDFALAIASTLCSLQ